MPTPYSWPYTPWSVSTPRMTAISRTPGTTILTTQKKSASEFAYELKNLILSYNNNYDVEVGAIPDLFIQPQANVLELINDNIILVYKLLSLSNQDVFSDTDVDAVVYNESIVRSQGSNSTVVLTFSRTTIPTADITVRANFPVATQVDETTGASYIFRTTEDQTMYFASAASYFNTTTNKYELNINAECTSQTADANVAQNRINRPLRALSGFESVTNKSAAAFGSGPEGNQRLIDRYFISLAGSNPSTVFGLKSTVLDNYPTIADVCEVYGNDSLMTRAADDAGAIDMYMLAESPTTYTETLSFPGRSQLFKFTKQPVMSVTSVGAYVAGVDYNATIDTTSGYAYSYLADSGVTFVTASDFTPPIPGDSITVTYVYDALPELMQSEFTTEDRIDPCRNLLFKTGIKVQIVLAANLRVMSGYSSTTVLSAVQTVIINYVNSLGMDDDVEQSDIQQVVRAINGVDNFIFIVMYKYGDVPTLSDVSISKREYARILLSNLTITVI